MVCEAWLRSLPIFLPIRIEGAIWRCTFLPAEPEGTARAPSTTLTATRRVALPPVRFALQLAAASPIRLMKTNRPPSTSLRRDGPHRWRWDEICLSGSRGVAPGWYGMGLRPVSRPPPVTLRPVSLAPTAHHMPARGNEPRRVAANRELIELFEKKFQATLARIWGRGGIAMIALRHKTGFQPLLLWLAQNLGLRPRLGSYQAFGLTDLGRWPRRGSCQAFGLLDSRANGAMTSQPGAKPQVFYRPPTIRANGPVYRYRHASIARQGPASPGL